MQGVPNIRHSRLLQELLTDFNLTEPYRDLWPNRKDYTFLPRGLQRENKSRIDFFIISRNILPMVTECDIMPHLLGKLFDHKAITLSFRELKKRSNRARVITNKILKDEDIAIVVETAFLETYLHHRDPNIRGPWGDGLRDVGRINQLLREAGPSASYLPQDRITIEAMRLRENNLNLIRDLLRKYNLADIVTLPLTTTPDIFYDTLINNIRNEVSGYEHFIESKKRTLVKSLTDNLAQLKVDYANNSCEILAVERKLNKIINDDVMSEMEKFKYFENINGEKMTPAFLKLAKSSTTVAHLRDIVDDNNTPFTSKDSRTSYIREYYRKLYDDTNGEQHRISIEEFLGEHILSKPIVQNSRLTQVEHDQLEVPLTIDELDLAIKNCKKNSCGGMDGIGYQFLNKFWHLLRVPLFNYANFCFERGTLTESFKTAAIKLIPKKGDATLLKNWRPISLLNCSYKIISRALNNRLKSVTDRITSRAQKGFTVSRQIQEVLINIIQNIAKANASATPGCILAIDQTKAFDSVRHDYLTKVLNFFGFGPYITNMIMTTCTGRQACIIDEEGLYTSPFPLKIGAAQGDCPSPTIFIFCVQILIFKLELDDNIIAMENLQPMQVQLVDRCVFGYESNRETNKVEGFADDISACLQKNNDSLIRVKNQLDEFATISGLKCNFEKTALMPVGEQLTQDDPIRDLGFDIVNCIKLLGVKIDSKLECLKTAHNKTISKLYGIVRFWSRFHLSLPGRISIAKTLLYSQLGYIGSIISPTKVQIKTIENIIFGYVKSGLNIAKNRMTLPPKLGGLGLFDINDYITSLQVTWCKRALVSTRDCWRVDIVEKGKGSVITINPNEISVGSDPILNNIAVSWEKFTKAFYSTNNNYLVSNVLNNPLIKRNRNDPGKINCRFLEQQPPIDLVKFGKLRVSDFFEPDGLKTLIDINTEYDLNINVLTYLRLGGALTFFKATNRQNGANDGSCIDVRNFLQRFKKGSKQIRKVLEHNKTANFKIEELPSVITYYRLTNSEIEDKETIQHLYGAWNNGSTPNPMREFMFKFLNNSLPLNTRLSHYVANQNRECTFCTLKNVRPIHEESFIHLFYQCDTTSKLMDDFCYENIPELAHNNFNKKQFFLGQKQNDADLSNGFIYWAKWTLLFLVWESKVKKRLCIWQTLRRDFFYILGQILDGNSSIREQRVLSDTSLARNWVNNYKRALF